MNGNAANEKKSNGGAIIQNSSHFAQEASAKCGSPPAQRGGDTASAEIKKFMDLVKGTDIEELQWESGEVKIYLKRSEESIVPQSVQEKKQEPLKEKRALNIKSPMVGIFHRAQSNDYPPLVMEDNHVVPGQKVAIIEAMKIMKDVISSVKGKIVKVLVDDGSPVEYGQELFAVDTENPADEKDGGARV